MVKKTKIKTKSILVTARTPNGTFLAKDRFPMSKLNYYESAWEFAASCRKQWEEVEITIEEIFDE